MAGMHLTSGPSTRLSPGYATAASPFWRNTWLFAARQLFSTPQRYQQSRTRLARFKGSLAAGGTEAKVAED
jgi:hypothetical protein